MKKLIALTLVLVSALCLFAGCGASDEIVLPKQVVEDTMENRQKAGVEVAKAYWRKDPYMQYDNKTLTYAGSKSGWRASFDWESAPEYASQDQTLYSVCSSFAFDTCFQSFEYRLLDTRPSCLTQDLSLGKGVPEELLVYQHVNDHNDAAANDKAAEELRALVQPGDIVTYFRYDGSGHSVVYCGDLTGDGKDDLLHSDGKTFDFVNGEDRIEENGTIYLNTSYFDDAYEFLFDPSSHQYVGIADRTSIIRPANLDPAEYPLTEAVKTRLLYPDMAIFFTAECGNYGAVNADGELTYTLTVKNHGEQDYENLLVQFPAPKNAEIVKVCGESAKNKTVKLELDITAGQEIDLTFTVKPTGGVGSRIVAEGGYVHAIALPPITTAVQKTSFDAETVRAAIAGANGKEGADFANAVWQAITPDAPAIPEYADLRDELFDRKNVGENKMYALKEEASNAVTAAMTVPEYFGGRAVITSDNHRVRELRYHDLKAGDVVILAKSAPLDAIYGVFDGEFLVLAENGANRSLLDVQYQSYLAYDFFIALRPTQAM